MPNGEVAKLYATLGADTSGFEKGMQRADKGLKSFEKSAGGLGTLMQGAMGSLLAGASMAGLVAGTLELAKHGAEMERLATGYDELARRAGQSGDAMLAAMRKASAGTISDADLMLAANKSMMLGVADSAEELSQLLEVARSRGKKLGLSTSQAFSDIVTGIGRQSPLILDNLGIVVDIEAANQNYAKALGKTADALTETERKQALLNDVIGKTPEAVSAAADSMDELERFNATMANLKADTGRAMAPEAARFYAFLADSIIDLKQATDDYAEWNRGMRLDFLERGAADAKVSIVELRGEIEATGDPTGELAQKVADAEARMSDFEARANTTRLQLGFFSVSEQDAMMAAGGFGGALAAAKAPVEEIGEAAGEAEKAVWGLAASMAAFVQGAPDYLVQANLFATSGLAAWEAKGRPGYTAPETPITDIAKLALTLPGKVGDLNKFITDAVVLGEEAALQHSMAVLNNIAENADVWRKKSKDASDDFASNWESAADKVQKAIEDAFQNTADAVAQFVGEARGASSKLFDMSAVAGFGGMAPGADGPFEALFRATDIAAHSDSPWAAALGLDQDAAKRIVADFQAGLMSPDVIGLIDTQALIDHVRRQQEAEASQKAYAESVAAQAGIDPAAVMQALGIDPGGTAATQLIDGLKAGIAGATPGADVLAVINTDLADRKAEFTTAGGVVANMLFSGMVTGADKNILRSFATALIPMILEAIDDRKRRTGAGS